MRFSATMMAVLFFANAVPNSVQANCDPCRDIPETQAYVWPPFGTIPSNARFLLEQYNSIAVGPIADLAARHPRLEVGDGSLIPLEVTEVFNGQCALGQAVLVPTLPLPPGAQLRLAYDNASGTPVYPDDTEYNRAETGWMVGASPDTAAPIVTAAATQSGYELMPMGCGPARSALLSAPVSDDGPLLARVAMLDEAGAPVTTYLVPVDPVRGVSVGHDMCHGAFHYMDGAHFSVSLEWVDVSGNATSAGLVSVAVAPSP